MVQLFLRDAGRLNDSTEVLSVGAGNERILYWLADRVGRVVATDIYGDGAFASREAELSMLDGPALPCPVALPRGSPRGPVDGRPQPGLRRRLLRRGLHRLLDRAFRRPARRFPGGGGDRPGTAARWARDRDHRVPGPPPPAQRRARRRRPARRDAGVPAPPRHPAAPRPLGEAFTPRELRTRIVEPSGLRPMQPLDLGLSPESWGTVDNASYPLILVRVSRSVFTSVCLVMAKPEGAR